MKLVKYKEYFYNTVDTDGLVLEHPVSVASVLSRHHVFPAV